MGQTRSLNVGLKLAKAKYVARIDAGDFSFPGRLSRQLGFMTKHPEYAAVGTAAVMVDPEGRRVGIARRPRRFREVLLRMFYVSPLIHISAMMDRDTVLKMGGYDEDFPIGADHELWSKLIRSGYRVTSLRRALVGWEVAPDSLSFEHLAGRVTEEVSEIVRRNAAELAGVDVSLEEGRDIFTMFTLGLQTLSQEQIDAAESLFRRIFASLKKGFCPDMTERAVSNHLARNYLKLALHHMRQGEGSEARRALADGRERHGFRLTGLALYVFSLLGKGPARLLGRHGRQ
jgi:hypothetical protein